MGTPNYIHCTICGMSLGDDDCIVYYGPHWPDADCPSLTISDHATTRYAAVAESYDGKAILPSGLCICPPELCDLFWPTQDRAPPATMYIAIHPACEDMANRFMRTSSHAKIHSTGDLWLVLERRCASHIYVVIPRWFENGDLRFVPEIPLAETGVHSLDGYYVPRACLLRTGDDWEGWWDENPVDIPNLTADLMSNLERIDSTPDSKLFELLPNEMKNHVCSYLQDEELSLDCNYLMPQYMWAGMFFRITFLWDLDTRVVYDKTGSSKLDLENLNWEKLTRQVMSRAESSLGVQSGADEENAWGYSKVGLNVPGGFTNRRRIWQVLEEMRPRPLDEEKRTSAMNMAAQRGHSKILELLSQVEPRANLAANDPNDNGRTPLHCACGGGFPITVRWLLQFDTVKAAVDKKDNEGRTPLSYAAQTGFERTIRALLKFDAVDPSSCDHRDKTPYDYAVDGGHRFVARMIANRTKDT
ncbi:hypothetical protein FPSE_07771 [Fusarium pseudograminearum CS3096]|uniref:Uncharacterized protein n=1 Tax=Fusarium pseudograminearum (strain CS3096) TaxID=1028729 RepID=K3VDY9_FUSPC|nr:hypothetical protein FPSE_07771 [Fusarium pseudograminearum CS3096]EKJ72029.1 hypothetical protein FPSE_07771 [Fusarium pseudograminearum CS3096]